MFGPVDTRVRDERFCLGSLFYDYTYMVNIFFYSFIHYINLMKTNLHSCNIWLYSCSIVLLFIFCEQLTNQKYDRAAVSMLAVVAKTLLTTPLTF